ncbi:MAG: GntR family transcriptional regulator [Lentisphaeria bacterium]|nr:GntR family transcriptional regulator [Lentisphaeria bacterium]
MEYKQLQIADKIKEKISQGVYSKRLPTAVAMAEEFDVNVKTIQKAVNRLKNDGILTVSRKTGIQVNEDAIITHTKGVIEIIYESYTGIFAHPFWSKIWSGVLETISKENYQIYLHKLDADSKNGLLKFHNFKTIKAAGRIVLGVSDPLLFKELQSDNTPFIVAGDMLAELKVPQVSFDFTKGITDAVKYLIDNNFQSIAFIGETKTFTDIGVLNKFHAYCAAMREYSKLDVNMIIDVDPLEHSGAIGLEKLLQANHIPDAIIAAYDTQVIAIHELIKKYNLNIKIVGCDGLELPGISPLRPQVIAPLKQCGEIAAQNLVNAIASRHKVKSEKLSAHFCVLGS